MRGAGADASRDPSATVLTPVRASSRDRGQNWSDAVVDAGIAACDSGRPRPAEGAS